jgi:hypothetical protein
MPQPIFSNNSMWVDPQFMGQPQSSYGLNMDYSGNPELGGNVQPPTTSNLWGNTLQGLNVASGLFQGWNGLQQTRIARDSLKESKRQFNMNWDAQKNLTNQQLWERRNQQIGAAGGNTTGETPDDYVMRWGVK